MQMRRYKRLCSIFTIITALYMLINLMTSNVSNTVEKREDIPEKNKVPEKDRRKAGVYMDIEPRFDEKIDFHTSGKLKHLKYCVFNIVI